MGSNLNFLSEEALSEAKMKSSRGNDNITISLQFTSIVESRDEFFDRLLSSVLLIIFDMYFTYALPVTTNEYLTRHDDFVVDVKKEIFER